MAGELPGFGGHATVGKHIGDAAVSEERVRAMPRIRISLGICLTPEERL
jgi:hypothetical protein